MMHIIIAGSRNFNDYSVVEKEMMNYIGKFIGKLEIEIISGGATGVDTLGERFAHEHNLPLRICSCRLENVWAIGWSAAK